MKIQIYSLTSIADAVATVEAGADFIGVVVGEKPQVPEEIDARTARRIFDAIRSNAKCVALSLSPDREKVCSMVESTAADVVHLPLDSFSPEDLAWIRNRIAPAQIMRAVGIANKRAIEIAKSCHSCADYLLLDSAAPGTTADGITFAGATGMVHDWTISAEIARDSPIPVILAGGLSPENVADSIRRVRPWGVDSFTRTDVPGRRGVKDLARVRAFIEAARNAATDLTKQDR
jgi:phosphoribosylanthranilate isomerase